MVVPTVIFDPTMFEGMIDNFSKSLTYYPVTKTTDSITGQETLTVGTATTIYGHVFLKKNLYIQGKEALVQGGDAVLIVKKGVTIAKNDLIVFAGTTYRIDNTTMRYLDQTEFYQAADLFVTDA